MQLRRVYRKPYIRSFGAEISKDTGGWMLHFGLGYTVWFIVLGKK